MTDGMILWRIKVKSLNTLARLQRWGINLLLTTSPLCGLEEESIHLFFKCSYTRYLLLEVTSRLNNAIWTRRGQAPPAPTVNIRIGDMMEIIERFTHKPAVGGTYWLTLGSLSWHKWSERNRRLKQCTLSPPEIVSKEILRDASTIYGTDYGGITLYKISNLLQIEIQAIILWESKLLRHQ